MVYTFSFHDNHQRDPEGQSARERDRFSATKNLSSLGSPVPGIALTKSCRLSLSSSAWVSYGPSDPMRANPAANPHQV